VPTGDPQGIVDGDEATRLASAVGELGLQYVVLTSVDRDDLPDGGAAAFARVIDAITQSAGTITIEVLIPDFSGRRQSLDCIAATDAHVIGHNLETVRRLTPALRDRRAGYSQSLDVLRYLSEISGGRMIKSGLMVGLGESLNEIQEAMADLRHAGVSMVTLGQYLQPSSTSIPVSRFVPPEEFGLLEAAGYAMGFKAVIAGPLVRSSYHAAAAYNAT